MNRTDRLLAIVLELQGRGRVRAEDLARSLEVSKRTIYRDVLALNEAGVPVVSAPGQGYTLMDGYFLPPLRFTASEALMLLLGSDVVAQAFDTELAAAAGSAGRKIGAVLHEDVRREVDFLRAHLKLVTRDPESGSPEKLRLLRVAIVERLGAEFDYHKPRGDAERRNVDPHGLFRLNTAWMLAAFDVARGEMRHFRLDRMENLRLTERRFGRQADFKLERDPAREHRNVVVRALFGAEAAREVRRRPSFFAAALEDTPQGLLVTLHVRAEADVLPWLLSWGGSVRVLEPTSLRQALQEEARRMLGQEA